MNTWNKEQPKAPGIFDILRGAVVLAFSVQESKSVSLALPSALEGYSFERSLQKADHQGTMAIGIYQKEGRRYIAKYWQGKRKDLNYYFLVHEYLATKMLRRYFLRRSDATVAVPGVGDCFSSSQSFVAFFEFIEGKTVDALFPNDQLVLWKRAHKVLAQIGQELVATDRNLVGRRGPLFYLLISGAFAILLLVRRPKEIRLVLRSCFGLIMSAKTIFTKNLMLTHRDLTSNNLMLGSDGMVYILDFESLTYTVPGYDQAYLSVDPDSKSVAQLLPIMESFSFLECYILLHHVLGSGKFLSVNESYLEALRKYVSSKKV